MIKKLEIENFGNISQLECQNLGAINLIIGPNQSGKTTLLKALYSAIKTVESYQRGRDNRSDKEILSDKLFWTFQSQSLGNLVRKGTSSLSFKMVSDRDEMFKYSFGPATTKSVPVEENSFAPRPVNTIFIPAKEILSLREIIIDSRNRYQEFGFEDPYFDLAMALTPTTRGNNYKAFSMARQSIENMVGGKLDYDAEKKDWVFKDTARRIYEIALTSEGIKKLSILDILLGNHYLTPDSIIIIDEVEANLHPAMISKFMEVILSLAEAGIQFFIASHSYFVIKKLYILAHLRDVHIPVLSFNEGFCSIGDLHENMPKNAIIDESVNIYKEEIRL